MLLDEILSAYKDIDEVMTNAKTVVEIRHTLDEVPERQRRLSAVFDKLVAQTRLPFPYGPLAQW